MRCDASISPTRMDSKGVSICTRLRYVLTCMSFTFLVAVWKPPTYNSPYYNWKRGMYATITGITMVEPVRHFAANVNVMNQFYEWPRTRSEYNIFFKEVFRLPDFWSELGKKIVFGAVAAGGSTAIQLGFWQWIYGGTWSP